jgi:hypothetical protein
MNQWGFSNAQQVISSLYPLHRSARCQDGRVSNLQFIDQETGDIRGPGRFENGSGVTSGPSGEKSGITLRCILGLPSGKLT